MKQRAGMMIKMPNFKSRTLLFLLAGIVLPQTAFAYVGPGAGLSAIGTLVALIGAAFLLIVGFIWYPVKRLLRRNKTPDKAKDENPVQ